MLATLPQPVALCTLAWQILRNGAWAMEGTPPPSPSLHGVFIRH